MNDAAHLAPFRIHAQGVGIVAAAQFDDLAGVVLDRLVAADDVGIAQTDLATEHQALVFLVRRLAEVILIDVQFAGQFQSARAETLVLRMIGRLE